MAQTVVITGMHRSGTSLVASILGAAGVDLGDRLVAPGKPNPRGYFEDGDFVDFHNAVLSRLGRTFLVDEPFTFEATQEEEELADRLVLARCNHPRWGWKDPRTSLFLDFWDARLDASYVFVFRHPLDVLLSLLRRGDPEAVGLAEAVRSWELHNVRILEFAQLNPERCMLVHPQGICTSLDSFNDALQTRIGSELRATAATLERLYYRADLHSSMLDATQSFAIVEPRAADLYDQLLAAAHVRPPSLAQSTSGGIEGFHGAVHTLLPLLGSHRRGLLQVLVELVEPSATDVVVRETEELIQDQRKRIRELERDILYLSEHLEQSRFRRILGRAVNLPMRRRSDQHE